MKKTALSLVLYFGAIIALRAQLVFPHVTAAANTSGHITMLDHPQLNGNPNAVVFVSPCWEAAGDQNPVNAFGVWYNGSRWTIFNQNRLALPASPTEHLRFKVLAFPAATPNTFIHTVTSANKSGHITTLDHSLLNNNPDAVVLVTQNYGVYNDHETGVWYDAGRWKVFNQDRAELPLNARFNIFIATNGGGIAGAVVQRHTHTAASGLGASQPGYTVLDHPALNNNGQWHLFVTQRWIGAYNPRGYNIWYDDPATTDPYHYRDGRWFIYNSQNEPMPDNAAFNILAIRGSGGVSSGPLWGFADLHTHPATHLAFGANGQGKNLFWGSPGLGLATSNIAADLPPCNHEEHAWDEADVTRQQTRKFMAGSLSGDYTGFTHGSGGNPSFVGWPHARSVIHQQMHVSWIRRAYDGGLRLMVASVTDNQLIAKLWNRGAGDGGIRYDPNYDYNSARTQLAFIRRFAGANSGWMEVVTTAAQARSAIANNRLAVVLALEMDDLSVEQINGLADEFGVRLVTPVHMMNNKIGGAAAYSDLFNSNNKFATGHFYHVKADTSLDFRLARPGYLKYAGAGIWQRLIPFVRPFIPFVNLLPLQPLDLFLLFGPELGIMTKDGIPDAEYRELGYDCNAGAPSVGNCASPCDGHKNVLGLRKEQLGRLMQRGLLIDLAHMSEGAQSGALELSDQFNYPMLNSHTGIRGSGGAERAIRVRDAQRMAARGGVLGLGTEGGGYPRTTIYSRSGSPVVRFTGSYQRWTENIGPENRIPNTGIIRELVITIRTGGDDLRGNNDNAIGMLLGASGRILVDNLDLNRRANWGNGSLNPVRVAVPGSVRRGDIRQFGIRTTFGGGIGGDNWNMDDIKVEAIDNAGNREIWMDLHATPLKRFTGSDKTWSHDIPSLTTEIPGTAVLQRIDFTIRTGGDDLRGGNDNAAAVLVLLGCQNQPVRIDLNRGANWGNGSVNRVAWTPPPGTRFTKSELVAFRIETSFGGGISGDNWNVDELTVRVTTDRGSYDLVSERGSPFMRFTGDMPAWERLLTRPQTLANNTPLRCLQLTINTGGDDLRGNNDNAFALIGLADGSEHEFPLNLQHNWVNGSTHSAILCLPAAVPRSQLRTLSIRTTFGGGIAGDNWNINNIQLDAITDDPVAVWTRGAGEALSTMGNGGLALGSDINGLAPQMPFSTQNVQYPLNYQPRVDIRTPQMIGSKTLDFTRDGLAHIGMLPEFMQLIRQSPGGPPVVDALFRSADDFVRMWERVEAATPAVNLTAIQNQLVTLNLTLHTGGDDLRGGNDNAYGYIYLRDGGFYEFPLNNGANWGNGSRNTASFILPHGKTQRDVAVFGIRTNSGGGISGDNWNLDRVEIQYSSVSGGTGTLLSRSGVPLVRFTGSNQNWRVNL